MYETFEHTADLGLRVEAPDLSGLLAESGRGLCSILVDNIEDVRPEREIDVEVEGTDREYLLFDWLSELLYLYETERLLLSDFEIELAETGLKAKARGEPADPDRHRLSHEVKAITYHGLRIEQTAGGWTAEVIVDI